MILMVETRTPNPDISQGEKNLMQWEHDGDSENKSINEWNHEKNVECEWKVCDKKSQNWEASKVSSNAHAEAFK